MTKNILIDSAYPEETRVAVEEGGKLVEYDFVTTTKKRVRGNIYLGKITRVEASLQAVFVEYGENKQGFLPFSEIHPDYYQIPVEDREKLIAEQLASLAPKNVESEVPVDLDEGSEVEIEEDIDADIDEDNDEDIDEDSDETAEKKEDDFYVSEEDEQEESEAELEAEDKDDKNEKEKKQRFIPFHKRYKIQEVVKKNQVILVQISKEERGNKGATLTSYVTIAGRYCVLMVNTPTSGGVSRKITNAEDRAKLKEIIDSFSVSQGMSVIIRTAGNSRGKIELKKDYTYLVKLWNSIRENALKAEAPALIHEESHLVKTTIRDFYDDNVDKIIIDGVEEYKIAKNFMKILIPSNAKCVKAHKSNTPIFSQYGIEKQILEIYNSQVHLKSGGYLVIDPTEALVSIDVNSGKSTSEKNIEETALKTNLEAAEEIARQLKLRGLSGLIVIDFIDMMNYRNRRYVERAAREAFKKDKAKVQIGRISPFGLMEMSRQRLGANTLESTTYECPYCEGAGAIRSTEFIAIQILNSIKMEIVAGSKIIKVRLSPIVSNYINNNKRDVLASLEKKSGVTIIIETSGAFKPQEFVVIKQPISNRKYPTPKKVERVEKEQVKEENKLNKPKYPKKQKNEVKEVEKLDEPSKVVETVETSEIKNEEVEIKSPVKKKSGIKYIKTWFATEETAEIDEDL